ncbi:MAG: T9SS type A sorting domain-containing protein, partial [Saprospiraceae bacterium]
QQTISTAENETFIGYPKGYGDDHFIEPNTPIEYVVRFPQPTDNEQIIIEVLVPEALDINQLRGGATNGTYEFVLEENAVQFIFSDFVADEMGFIKFNVPQKANLPLGTIINVQVTVFNTFAEFVAVDDYFHTVQTDFVQLSTNTTEVIENAIALSVFPNPATDNLTIVAAGDLLEDTNFELLDVSGKVLQSFAVQANRVQIPSLKLAAGMYFFRLQKEGVTLEQGKLMVK